MPLAASSDVASNVLDLGPIGDVVACRRTARRFWSPEASPPTLDLLVLTAACVLATASCDAPAIEHLSAELRRLGDPDHLAALRSHPSQFASYAVAELEALASGDRLVRLRALRRRVESGQVRRREA